MTTERVAHERALMIAEAGAEDDLGGRAEERLRRPRRKPDFEALYAAHARPLLAFLVYRTGERALAEDVLADTFERVLRAHKRFDPSRGSEKTWLYAIALNCLRDQARRASAEARALKRATGPAAEPDEPLDRLAVRDLLQRGLAGLSEDERLVISLRFGADLTMPEIARLIGQPLTTAEGRVYRALAKLRTHMGQAAG